MAATPSGPKAGAYRPGSGRGSVLAPAAGTPARSLARHVKAVLLALGQDRRILAHHVHWDREEPLAYRDKLQAILNSSVWGNVLADKKSSSYELRVGASTVFCLEIDEEWRVFCAVVTAAYPSRHIFSGSSDQHCIMRDFRAHVLQHLALPSLASQENGLQGTLAPFFTRLCAKFDDLDALDRPLAAPALPLYGGILGGALAIAGVLLVVLNYAAFHWWGEHRH